MHCLLFVDVINKCLSSAKIPLKKFARLRRVGQHIRNVGTHQSFNCFFLRMHRKFTLWNLFTYTNKLVRFFWLWEEMISDIGLGRGVKLGRRQYRDVKNWGRLALKNVDFCFGRKVLPPTRANQKFVCAFGAENCNISYKLWRFTKKTASHDQWLLTI